MFTVKDCSRRVYVLLLAMSLIACGGDSDDDDDNNVNAGNETFYGFFIDDAVQGLIVDAENGGVQTTDENGVFSFEVGDPLSFFVDDVFIGSIDSGLERLTPADLASNGSQVFRFLQSLDTSPGTPGIDLTGIDLPDTPINFSQQSSFFENDPAVQLAIQASMAAGAAGVLIDFTVARDNYLAATNRIITQPDFEGLVAYPVAATGPNEPCIVFFNADLSGESICRDDIQADPADAAEDFDWSVVGGEVVADIDADTRSTITRNGITGNRVHVRVATECLTCDPDKGTVLEVELQTFHTALPIDAADFNGVTMTLSGSGDTVTATFDVGGGATLDDNGSVETANWSVTPDNVLLLQGTGNPGDPELSFVRAILIEGVVTDGRFAVLNGLVDDSGDNGMADQAEFDANGVYDGIELQDSSL